MSRLRCEWGWVKNYPVFVFMRFICQNKWEVKVVKGKQGNQNIGNTGPNAPAWFEFISHGLSRSDVYKEAENIAISRIEKELEDER